MKLIKLFRVKAVAAVFILLGTSLGAPVIAAAQSDSSRTNNAELKASLQELRENAKSQAKTKSEEIKQQVKDRKIELKKEVCERRQARLINVPSRMNKNASTLQGVLDKKYAKVQEFYTTKNLTVTNYDTLKSNVDTAQAASQAAVDALKDYNFTFSCDTPGLGQQLDGLRSTANEAKTKIKEYRKALIALITAISNSIDEEATNSTSTTGGTSQ